MKLSNLTIFLTVFLGMLQSYSFIYGSTANPNNQTGDIAGCLSKCKNGKDPAKFLCATKCAYDYIGASQIRAHGCGNYDETKLTNNYHARQKKAKARLLAIITNFLNEVGKCQDKECALTAIEKYFHEAGVVDSYNIRLENQKQGKKKQKREGAIIGCNLMPPKPDGSTDSSSKTPAKVEPIENKDHQANNLSHYLNICNDNSPGKLLEQFKCVVGAINNYIKNIGSRAKELGIKIECRLKTEADIIEKNFNNNRKTAKSKNTLQGFIQRFIERAKEYKVDQFGIESSIKAINGFLKDVGLPGCTYHNNVREMIGTQKDIVSTGTPQRPTDESAAIIPNSQISKSDNTYLKHFVKYIRDASCKNQGDLDAVVKKVIEFINAVEGEIKERAENCTGLDASIAQEKFKAGKKGDMGAFTDMKNGLNDKTTLAKAYNQAARFINGLNKEQCIIKSRKSKK